MKPREETWKLAREGSRTMLCGPDPYPAADFYGPEGDARILLAAAAPEMARLLLDAEFVTGIYDVECREFCPWCKSITEGEPDGKIGTPYVDHPGKHAPGCRLVVVLRKAGVLP